MADLVILAILVAASSVGFLSCIHHTKEKVVDASRERTCLPSCHIFGVPQS